MASGASETQEVLARLAAAEEAEARALRELRDAEAAVVDRLGNRESQVTQTDEFLACRHACRCCCMLLSIQSARAEQCCCLRCMHPASPLRSRRTAAGAHVQLLMRKSDTWWPALHHAAEALCHEGLPVFLQLMG